MHKCIRVMIILVYITELWASGGLGGLTQENSRIEVREEFIYFYFVL